jgi:hypothetical protein
MSVVVECIQEYTEGSVPAVTVRHGMKYMEWNTLINSTSSLTHLLVILQQFKEIICRCLCDIVTLVRGYEQVKDYQVCYIKKNEVCGNWNA